MKNFIFIAALLFAAFQPQAQTAQFTSVSTVVPANYSTKVFTITTSAELNPLATLPHNVEVVRGNKSNRTIIEIHVSANVKESILNSLVLSNRYAFDIQSLSFINVEKSIFINGVQLDEVLKVKIYTK